MLFLTHATGQGYNEAAARRAFDRVRAQLAGRELERPRYYIFRSGGRPAGAVAGADPGEAARPRRLPAFPSADAAISFAQAAGLGTAPRLAALSLDQLLAVLIQRPSITALLFVDESAPPTDRGWPAGIWVTREALLVSLAGGASITQDTN